MNRKKTLLFTCLLSCWLISSSVSGQFLGFGKRTPQLPVVFSQTPSQQQLFQVFDTRYQSVKQLNSNVTISMPGMPKIKGVLQIELPNRLRLKAGIMGVSELGVDVGTNENDFWIWTKASLPGQPPAFYFANQQAFKQSAVYQTIPLDPNWLMKATGLIRFPPNEVHRGPVETSDGLVVFSARPSASGRQMIRTLIHPKTGLIRQQAIYNSANRLLAYSNSTDYRVYNLESGNGSISLPHLVEIHMIQENGKDEKMVVRVSKYDIDSLFGDPARMWTMPNPSGVQKIDLTQIG